MLAVLATLLAAPGAAAEQTTVVSEHKRLFDADKQHYSIYLDVANPKADTQVVVTVGGHEVQVIGDPLWNTRLVLIDLFPTPPGPSWVPGPGTYPVHVGGTSGGEPISVDLEPLTLDPRPSLTVKDPPTVVVAGDYIDLVVDTWSVVPYITTSAGPLQMTGEVKRDADGSRAYTAYVRGPLGPGIVDLVANGLDGTQVHARFDVQVDHPTYYLPSVSVTNPDPYMRYHTEQLALPLNVYDRFGIASYQQRIRSAPMGIYSGSWSAPTPLPAAATAVQLPVRLGQTTCVEVRATNVLGLTGAWSNESCATGALDDTRLRLVRNAHRDTVHHHTVTVLRGPRATVKLPGTWRARTVVIRARANAAFDLLKVRIGSGHWHYLEPSTERFEERSAKLANRGYRTGTLQIRSTSGGKVKIDAVAFA